MYLPSQHHSSALLILLVGFKNPFIQQYERIISLFLWLRQPITVNNLESTVSMSFKVLLHD